MKKRILNAETRRRGEKFIELFQLMRNNFLILSLCLCVSAVNVFAQETPPEPSAPRSVSVPAIKEKKLPNGLTVAVVEKTSNPIVTVQLLVKSGASSEDISKAGLANLTASMLTKGTKTRTATQIAEQMEFLGGSINTGAGWNNSAVTITVTSDKLDQAMAIMADVVLNPAFDQKELDLLKSQTLDGLTYNLKQPGFLASYVASKYSFGEHPAGGTPASLSIISRDDAIGFHQRYYVPGNVDVIFVGDVTTVKAQSIAQRLFLKWGEPKATKTQKGLVNGDPQGGIKLEAETLKRILVIDLANSGQASVSYTKKNQKGRVICFAPTKCQVENTYYPATVLNSVLGGGYSSRLNQEIRIKRGLSYGAGSSFAWRGWDSNFSTRTQTKNESAAEVAELVLTEIKRLTTNDIINTELIPRKSVLTGNFGRNLETTDGLAGAASELYSFGIPTSELNAYVTNVNAVTDAQIREFASANLLGGDIIIVGDYAKFKDDLAKRFPNMTVDVIKADELDLSKDNLRK
jgi:zinc protease